MHGTHRCRKNAKMFLHVRIFNEFSGIFTPNPNILTKLNAMETLKTAEQEEFQYAGFWLRFAAYIIDYLILGVVGFFIAIPAIIVIVSIALGFDYTNEPKELLMGGNLIKVSAMVGVVMLLALLSMVINWLYYALFESSKYGGTLGKLAVGIRVTNCKGERISFGQATGRYFAKIISNLTLYIGYIMAGFTEKKQALHDMVANCIVIKR